VTDMVTVELGIDVGSLVAAVEPYIEMKHMVVVELDKLVE